MPLNKQKKILFIHNPKCGGSSIEKYLGMSNKNNRMDMNILFGLHTISNPIKPPTDPIERKKNNWRKKITPPFNRPLQHLTPQQLIDHKYISEKDFRSYFSFVFVRNPWDKVISSYLSYFKTLYPDFNKFLMWIKEMVEYEKENDCFVFRDKGRNTINTHFKEQHKFLTYNGDQIVNFIGRHENLKNDFSEVCSKNNIPIKPLEKINSTAKKLHYSKYYNDKQAEMISEIYNQDIEMFGYKFERNGK